MRISTSPSRRLNVFSSRGLPSHREARHKQLQKFFQKYFVVRNANKQVLHKLPEKYRIK